MNDGELSVDDIAREFRWIATMTSLRSQMNKDVAEMREIDGS